MANPCCTFGHCESCDPDLNFEVVGSRKIAKVNEAIRAAGIKHEVTEVKLCVDGRYFMTITGR